MADEILQKLIEFIENASPAVWGMLVKQVYAEAFANFAWAMFLAGASVLLYKLAKRLMVMQQEDSYESWDIGAYFCYGGMAITVSATFGLIVSTILHLLNPEFYAIRFILTQIGGGQ